MVMVVPLTVEVLKLYIFLRNHHQCSTGFQFCQPSTRSTLPGQGWHIHIQSCYPWFSGCNQSSPNPKERPDFVGTSGGRFSSGQSLWSSHFNQSEQCLVLSVGERLNEDVAQQILQTMYLTPSVTSPIPEHNFERADQSKGSNAGLERLGKENII